MPMLPHEPPAGRPQGPGDFVVWWWPEFASAAACISAGLTLWGPLAAFAAVPLLHPAAEAIHLAAEARQEIERERIRLAAIHLAALEPSAMPPVAAAAERLDRPEIGQAQR